MVLKRRGPKTAVCQIPDKYFTDQELRELQRQIHSCGSEFFFAKCVLLTEGPTETAALPVFAKALKINLDQLGVSLLCVSGQNFRSLIRLFQQPALDTPCLIMCDNDNVATATANILSDLGIIGFKVDKATIEARRTDLEEAGLFFLPEGNFEEYIMSEGHVAAYEHAIAEVYGATRLASYVKIRTASDATYSKKTKEAQIVDFIKSEGGKPELAFEAASFIKI